MRDDGLLLNWWRREISGSPSRRDNGGEVERRSVPAGQIELRQTPKGQEVTGYAALFGVMSGDLGGFRERIERGAFSASLRDDVRALWQHDATRPLARTTNGTLRLSEDDRGLRVWFVLPATSWGNDAAESIRRGDVTQMSFGFSVLPNGDSWDRSTVPPVRTLRRVRLFDVSPVTFPAYAETAISVSTRQAALLRVPRAGGRRGDWRTNNLREWFRWAALG